MKRKCIGLILAAAMLLGLCACGEQGQAVNVQRADRLAQDGQNVQRYPAMVVSEDAVTVQRDGSKPILECYVTVGQQVRAGEVLFSYDMEQLELDLEKQQLELEKLQNEQQTYAGQLEDLEKKLKNTWSESEKVRLTLEINMLKTTQLENNYTILSRQKSIEQLEQVLQNVDIVSPIDGEVRSISQEEGDPNYITIQQEGAYRLKGTINEMHMGSLMVGSRIRAVSRLDKQVFWEGTVISVDTGNASQDQIDPWTGYAGDEMMITTSGYVFLAELDSVDGLLLGQHLYVEPAMELLPGLWIPESFLAEVNFNEETGMMTAQLWVANGQGKLEKRQAELGMYDSITGCYEILSGVAGEDFVADPTAPGCEQGAAVTYRDASDFAAQTEG